MDVKVGDRVRCAQRGEGVVTEVLASDAAYPIRVRFDDNSSESYTADGSIYQGRNPTLTVIARTTDPSALRRWVCKDPANGGFFITAGRYRDKTHVEESVVDATPIIAIPGS